MKTPEIPKNEKERLESLEAYAVLDTPPEADLDALTRLVAAICGTPIALISLVDQHRQWFKSKVGLEASETPRSISFCGHAVAQGETLVIEDALLDSRFADNPLVTGKPNIRFYAGAPLTTASGMAVGTLCAIDSIPRALTDAQKEALETLSRMVITHLELKKRNAELAQALEWVQNQKAGMIEQSKLTALGELAAGIAHEINNPLAIISGYVHRLRKGADSAPLDGITQSVERISGIIRGLQTLARKTNDDLPETIDLRHLIEEFSGMVREGLRRKGIELIWNAPEDPFQIRCRPGDLHQILLSLISNARDSILMSASSDQNRWIKISVHESKTLRIEDSGPGVPAALQDRIFNPFFTTKPPGSGTGLGLSMAESLAKTNGATLSYQPEKGPSCFELTFGK